MNTIYNARVTLLDSLNNIGFNKNGCGEYEWKCGDIKSSGTKINVSFIGEKCSVHHIKWGFNKYGEHCIMETCDKVFHESNDFRKVLRYVVGIKS